MAAVSTDELVKLLGPVVAGASADLEDVVIRKAGARSVVVVTVDRDGGVELDAIADISRRISDILDENDVMGQTPYVLEVGSPGVDRPLTEPRHWRRAKLGNRLVKVATVDGNQLTGRVEDFDNDSVVVGVQGQAARRLAYSDISKAVVQVEFSTPKGDE